jgi:RHS repeat-associated protein
VDGTGATQALFLHGPGIDEPLAVSRFGTGGGTFVYHADGLGSIATLTDNSGTPAQTYTYDSFGQIVDQTGSAPNPYTYTARELDPETGLFYYRRRYYDPSLGVFLQTDPVLGLMTRPTSLHPYAYVLNNPTTLTDPNGQIPPQVGLAVTGAILGGMSGAFGAIIAGGNFSQVAAAAATGAVAGAIVGFVAPNAIFIGAINFTANITGQVIGGRSIAQANVTAAILAGLASGATGALTNFATAGLTLSLGEQIGYQLAFAQAGGSILGIGEFIGRVLPLTPSDIRRLFEGAGPAEAGFCPGP